MAAAHDPDFFDFDDIPFGDESDPADTARSETETTYDPLDPDRDVFKPPAISTLVSCLHCGEVYESFLIEWRIDTNAKGRPHGFFCCPTEGCDGRGFGFDIFPIDPDWTNENGERMWVDDDEDEVYDDEGEEAWAGDCVDAEYEEALMGWDAEDEAQWRVDEDVEDYEIDLRLEPGEPDDSERPY